MESREGSSRRGTGRTNWDHERVGAGERQVGPIGIQRREEQDGDRKNQ